MKMLETLNICQAKLNSPIVQPNYSSLSVLAVYVVQLVFGLFKY